MFQLEEVTLIYDIEKEDKVYAIKDISLTLPKTGMIGIIGPSGSGKSTLMYCLSTLKNPTSGQITYSNDEAVIKYNAITKHQQEDLRREQFGFAFQRHFLINYMSILDNVIVAAVKQDNLAINYAKELLLKLGLKEHDFSKKPTQLSGGQRQRVAIARAMINHPEVLFADEPTASLDHAIAYQTMGLFEAYAKDHLVLIITHDRSILKNADRIIEIWDGCIREDQVAPFSQIMEDSL